VILTISVRKRYLFSSCLRPYLLGYSLKRVSKTTQKPLFDEVWGKQLRVGYQLPNSSECVPQRTKLIQFASTW
jgi:hypothetical protein